VSNERNPYRPLRTAVRRRAAERGPTPRPCPVE
jgi:hypothetical protein